MSAPFKKVLVANRGEIAVRVIRACAEMQIPTVAVFSDADRDALHVRFADEAYRLGPPPSSESYLAIDKILDVARRSGADGIHPGYGFLAENDDFARACADAGVTFIGPPASAMEIMGDKVRARERMVEAGVPVVPGSPPVDGNAASVTKTAEQIGYPVLIKASAGGGGKGMRLVRSSAELPSLLEQARSEAAASFGDDTVFIEKFVERPRHIEVQVMADRHGRCVHLGERECSIQRRHQKLIEEAPSPVVDAKTRAEIGELGVRAAQAVDYVGAGTIEFLRGDDGSFYFMEMNTRLQVEHPVTEIVYGVDLVKAQLRVAAGEPLALSQEELKPSGHAIECRIIAEDPEANFMPAPGTIRAMRVPAGPGVRVDGGVYPGYEVPIFYDPLLSKLIASGRTREAAIHRMRRALDEYRIEGPKTSIPFHRRVMEHPAFIAGELHTGFLEEHPELIRPRPDERLEEIAVIAAAVHHFRRTEQLSASSVGASSGAGASAWRRAGRQGWRR